ncbi:MAG TPA: DnaD domain protein [Anaerolineales bacterium]|nr:DnaD domain protein [Anaerolineales bacterium]
METFRGFLEENMRLTPVPGQFFSELLLQIDHLGELKLILYSLWLLDHKEGSFKYLCRQDFAGDERFMHGLSPKAAAAGSVLDDALRRAVQRGFLLQARVPLEDGMLELYFLNSPKGRAAVEAVARGEWRPSGETQQPLEIRPEPSNLFNLYENHIGPLTPLIAEALQDAEATYPASWFEEAFRIAVENNARSWRYVEAILRRWKEKGRHERKDRRDTEKARRRYTEWEDDSN